MCVLCICEQWYLICYLTRLEPQTNDDLLGAVLAAVSCGICHRYHSISRYAQTLYIWPPRAPALFCSLGVYLAPAFIEHLLLLRLAVVSSPVVPAILVKMRVRPKLWTLNFLWISFQQRFLDILHDCCIDAASFALSAEHPSTHSLDLATGTLPSISTSSSSGCKKATTGRIIASLLVV